MERVSLCIGRERMRGEMRHDASPRDDFVIHCNEPWRGQEAGEPSEDAASTDSKRDYDNGGRDFRLVRHLALHLRKYVVGVAAD